MKNIPLTTHSVEAGNADQLTPEFVRLPELEKLFGIKRSYAYLLMNSGAIKSFSARVPGSKTGIRLIHVESVRSYLKKQMEVQG